MAIKPTSGKDNSKYVPLPNYIRTDVGKNTAGYEENVCDSCGKEGGGRGITGREYVPEVCKKKRSHMF